MILPRTGRLLERLGAWAFRHRSWTPVPLALILLLDRWDWIRAVWPFDLGLTVVLAGLAIRCWGVSHIGTISRTRAGRLGPLMTSGPYAFVRNPLYLGNLLIWTGFAVASGLLWMLPVAWAAFALQYTAISRFEEAALIDRFGATYLTYMQEVPRWAPRLRHIPQALGAPGPHGWREVACSERGTLISALTMTPLRLARRRWLA
jgi:protein-S-isoprenylcysteine O-methyltransferase Ste14